MDDQNAPSLTHSNSIFQRLQFMFLKVPSKLTMAIRVVEFSSGVYKIRKIFA